MSLAELEPTIQRLLDAHVANVTVTGGEPLVHPDLGGILGALVERGIEVTVCTNGVSLTDDLIELMVGLRRVKVNVSLDGLSAASHGRFRGNLASFESTARNARRLAEAGLLKGVLSTPNSLAASAEYAALYDLARELEAEYLLLNPLSSFGRGIATRRRLAADENAMDEIRTLVLSHSDPMGPEPVFIRFPNSSEPLTGCMAGDILYISVDGRTTVCPYLVFATENTGAQHSADEFVVGNLFTDADFANRVDDYRFHERYPLGTNGTCSSCARRSTCGTGCPAAVIAAGGRIGDLDGGLCPIVRTVRRRCS